MEFFEVIAKRRSVRKFIDTPVPEDSINRAIDAALRAPNSSNLQAWEFLWVRTPELKAKLKLACLNQNAARTAQELIVCVSRIDSWKKHRNFLLSEFERLKIQNKVVDAYYKKLIPMLYTHDPFGLLGLGKKILFNIAGLFRTAPRGPCTRAELYEVTSKSTALACENLMLALVAEGLASCPMEGLDEARVKSLLKIKGKAHVAMVIGIGYAANDGIYHEQMRVPRDWVVKEL